jgi:hypothetical protein
MPSIASALTGRQGCEPLLLDVDAVLPSPPAARGREPGEVRRRRAGREHAAPRRRQPEELLQPVHGDLLELHGERRRDPVERDLVERAREPVGRERGRRPAAHHEVEEARPGRPRRADLGRLDQRAERRDRADSFVRERAAESVRRPDGPHERLVHAGQVLGGLPRDEPEALVQRVAVEDRVGHCGDPLMHPTLSADHRAWPSGW